MTQDAYFPNRPTAALVSRAQVALGMTHRQIGEVLGASERTSQRWVRGSSSLSVDQLRTLAPLVFPRDARLAAEIAAAASETLESLGVVARSATPLAPAHAADLVACAAADAIGVTPGAARAALRAGLQRMRELGVSAADVEKALAARKE